MITWIIGQGGLLGSALARRFPRRFEPGPVPWHDPITAAETLNQQARSLEASTQREPWRVIWAAGAATTSSSKHEAEAELLPLEGLLSGLRNALPGSNGAFFLTSSAGGVYAGSAHPPFTATTQPAPLSPYGELKLAQEALAARILASFVPVVIGRISNLYGPGQNLDKLQGLISRLALAAVTRQPINVFVPLDTIRDYIYADDAAAAIDSATAAAAQSAPHTSIEIIASGRGTTVGQLIRTMDEIAKRRVPVALGSHPSASAQALDLRLEPTVTIGQLTPLPVGVKAVYNDILMRTQQDVLAMSR